jgi:ribose-phosphate pyrophosphokinase
VTHGVFTAKTPRLLLDAPLDALTLTDSVPLADAAAQALDGRLTVLPLAPLVAQAIRRRHENGSITELLANGP